MNLLQYIRQIIKDNEKVDCFAISIVINKNNKNVVNMDREIVVKANYYPRARDIKKLYEDEISETILKNKFYGAKVYVHFICKIGTYKRKDTKLKKETK